MRILVLLILMSQLCLAGLPYPENLTCPVCSTSFEGHTFMSSTSFGTDRDFLWRSSSPFYRTLASCPDCSYTHFTETIREPLAPSVRDEWRKQHPVGSYEERDLVGIIRLVIQLEELRDVPPLTLANVYLQGAWIVRLTHNPFEDKIGQLGHEKVRTYLDSLPTKKHQSLEKARELLKTLPEYSGAEQGDVATIVSYLYCDAGEYQELLANSELPQNGVKETQAEEREFQRQAVKHLREAVKSAEGQEKANLTYLIVEIERRLGRKGSAKEWLKKASQDELLTPELKDWAQEQLQACERLTNESQNSGPGLIDRMGGPWIPTTILVTIFAIIGYRRSRARV